MSWIKRLFKRKKVEVAETKQLNIPAVSVRFSDSISAGKYLREVGRDTDFWFPVHSVDIITHANKVWNELNAH
jgi:hypothetical protein